MQLFVIFFLANRDSEIFGAWTPPLRMYNWDSVDGSLEFHGGRGWRWCLIGNHPSGTPEDNGPYLICEESIGMFLDAEQPDGVAIVHQQHAV